jgi:outer membrane lipoprotein-sorting protein
MAFASHTASRMPVRFTSVPLCLCGEFLLITMLAGCAARVQPAALLPADAAARLAAVQAREDQVRSLRARFSSVTRLPGGDRSADGVLLVAKPDRFRLRLMLPFGITVFDYLNVGDRSWMTLPLASGAQRTQAGEFAPFSRDDLGQAFLRGAYAFPGRCVAAPAADGDVSVSCREGGALRRTLRIGTDGILEETSFENGTPRLVIRYGDYRDVGGVALPFHIALEYPQRQQQVDIGIDRYEVNPALSDEIFQPLPDSTAR